MGNSLGLENFTNEPAKPDWVHIKKMEREWNTLKQLEAEILLKIQTVPNRRDLKKRQVTIAKRSLAKAIDICPTNFSKNLEYYRDLLEDLSTINSRLQKEWGSESSSRKQKTSNKNKSELAAENERLEKKLHEVNESKISELLQNEIRHGNVDLARREKIARAESRDLRERNENLENLNETLLRENTELIKERTDLMSQVSLLRSRIEKLQGGAH